MDSPGGSDWTRGPARTAAAGLLFVASACFLGFSLVTRSSRVVQQGDAPARAIKLDVNRATAEELDALPGIGAVLSRRIVESRESGGAFPTLEALTRVKGIAPGMVERLRPFLEARPPEPAAETDEGQAGEQ